MKKWEYLIIKVHKPLDKREFGFNVLGSEEGWELVAIDNEIAYFKRPRQELSEQEKSIIEYFMGKPG